PRQMHTRPYTTFTTFDEMRRQNQAPTLALSSDDELGLLSTPSGAPFAGTPAATLLVCSGYESNLIAPAAGNGSCDSLEDPKPTISPCTGKGSAFLSSLLLARGGACIMLFSTGPSSFASATPDLALGSCLRTWAQPPFFATEPSSCTRAMTHRGLHILSS
ncbi:hypothetical protein Vretifemale_2398, partial [Volvox reticuliferus]